MRVRRALRDQSFLVSDLREHSVSIALNHNMDSNLYPARFELPRGALLTAQGPRAAFVKTVISASERFDSAPLEWMCEPMSFVCHANHNEMTGQRGLLQHEIAINSELIAREELHHSN